MGECAPSNIIDFLALVSKLKTTKRTGWINHGVPMPESIADHMYRMGLMSFFTSSMGIIDKEKCIKMSLVHDLAEAIVGDITPFDGISNEKKHELERRGFDKICSLLNNSEAAEEMRTLWEEYESNLTIESRAVHEIDKLEMIMQAFEYEQRDGLDLSDFFESTKGYFTVPTIISWVEELYNRRAKRQLASSS